MTVPKITLNEIHNNEKNGVKCKGEKNCTQIIQNKIHLNRKSGIYTKNKANVTICKNEVFKNIGQGICVQETSSVFAESNIVRENIKANIAIGGRSERESILLKNTITDGRCEGIFLMESIMCRIFYNSISNNHYGIMSVNSSPTIIGNLISDNKTHGILCLKKSSFVISHNRIHNNLDVGLYMRDLCKGSIENNQVSENRIEVLIENRSEDFDKLLEPEKNNTIVGDVRIPTNKMCAIF